MNNLLLWIYTVFCCMLPIAKSMPLDHGQRYIGRGHIMWSPPESMSMTVDTFMATYGFGIDAYRRAQEKVRKIRRLQAEISETRVLQEPLLSSVRFDDIIYPLDILDRILERLGERRHHGRRVKRKVIDFARFPSKKWPNSLIPYTFSDSPVAHTDSEIQIILEAINQWQEETCIRFYEINTQQDPRPDYIIFSKNTGCYANYGRTGRAQLVNVGPECFGAIGYTIHEIGHALAFYHEQSRYDRDSYVRVLTNNTLSGHEHNFDIFDTYYMDLLEIPYDIASVMHYASKSFSRDRANLHTLESVDPLYQRTMGQRFQLTFFDAKAANKAYCSDICSNDNRCLRGGYSDPNDCSRCKCPDGFFGSRCESVTPSNSPVCDNAGVVKVTTSAGQCIQVNNYKALTSCSWLLQAEPGCRIDFAFEGSFEVLCSAVSGGPSCYHYVEVSYQENLAFRGPRFCCNGLPSFGSLPYLTSDFHEILVTFRSPFQQNGNPTYGGFTMCFGLNDESCLARPPTTEATTVTSPTTKQTIHETPPTRRTTSIPIQATFERTSYVPPTNTPPPPSINTSPTSFIPFTSEYTFFWYTGTTTGYNMQPSTNQRQDITATNQYPTTSSKPWWYQFMTTTSQHKRTTSWEPLPTTSSVYYPQRTTDIYRGQPVKTFPGEQTNTYSTYPTTKQYPYASSQYPKQTNSPTVYTTNWFWWIYTTTYR